jgi:heme-degrading monooxygenase HmoA
MGQQGTPYASGQWTVKSGRNDEFVAQWTEFVTWSLNTFGEFAHALLLHDATDPQHYMSVGRWNSKEQMDAWRADPGFQENIGKCVALCDNFQPFEYTVAAHVEGK